MFSCSAVSCMERVWSKPVTRAVLKHMGSWSTGQYTWCKEKKGCRWLAGAGGCGMGTGSMGDSVVLEARCASRLCRGKALQEAAVQPVPS